MEFPDQASNQTGSETDTTSVQFNQIGRDSAVDQRGQQVDTQYNIVGDAIIRIRQYVKHPPTFYSDLRTFFRRYWIETSLLIALQVLLYFLYVRLEGPYLIPVGAYIVAALALAVAGVVGVIALRRYRSKTAPHPPVCLLLATSLVALSAFIGVIGIQVERALNPFQFDMTDFGIAVATFSQGANGDTSRASYEISNLIENKLKTRIAEDSDEEGVRTSAVRVVRTGVLSDIEAAQQNPHNAKLIIWGVLKERNNDLEAKFTLFPTEDLTDNPLFPQAIPITERELTFSIPFSTQDCIDEEAEIERQSIGIAAFSFGLAHFYSGHPEKAVHEFAEARGLMTSATDGCVPDGPAVAKNLSLLNFFAGRSHQFLGDYEKSQKLFKKAATEMADDPALIYAMIYNYRVFGQEEERQDAYRRLLKISTNPPPGKAIQAAYDRALAHEALKDFDGALNEYEGIIAEDADFFVAYLGAGGVLTRQGRYEEALETFARAQPLADQHRTSKTWLLLNQGLTYEARNQPGDMERARDLYIEAIELDTSDEAVATGSANSLTSLHFYLANVYRKLGDTDAALKEYETLTELAEVPNWAYNTLAEYQFDIGDYKAAILNFEQALRYPAYSYKMNYARLGQAYAKVDPQIYPDREQKIVEAFENALEERGGGNEFVHFEYGVALFRLGRHDDGIEQMEIALALAEDPESEPPNFGVKERRNLGQMYKTIGETEKAISMFTSLFEHCDLVDPPYLEFAHTQLEELGVTDVECGVEPKG